ncbi:hypothetical protein PLICRDRAFT_157195 [Plicaturopsis crispa FD-325 SS-3]|nr:hypothetical protein PLICRDRAFT_157195 [Plicaturopsis crispa FD-325 SS-3]
MDLFHDVDNARVVAMFELPGVGKDQLSINLEGNSLIVAGERRPPRAAPRIKYARQEMRFGRFMRTLQLAPEIKPSHISASLDDGMLIITWPAPRASSVPPAQTPTRIEIA